MNIQKFPTSVAEFVARIQLDRVDPTVICLKETFLNAAIGETQLEDYSFMGRRERDDCLHGGGVAVFCKDRQADCVIRWRSQVVLR